MKRILFAVFMLLLLPCFCSAQVINEICGVKFGSTYSQAKSILEKRFGEATISSQDEIIFVEKTYAGVYFDDLMFQFQAGVFNKCMMGVICKDATDAKNQRDFIAKKLEGKYELFEGIASDKFKYYLGGTSPVDGNDFGFLLHVRKLEDVWYAILMYGPYDIVKEEF